jgi:hypothetical protein
VAFSRLLVFSAPHPPGAAGSRGHVLAYRAVEAVLIYDRRIGMILFQGKMKQTKDLKVFISSGDRDSSCCECGQALGRGAWIICCFDHDTVSPDTVVSGEMLQ